MGEWSPSHLIIAALALATIIGQAIAVLARLKNTTERLEKRLDKQDETIRQQGLTFFHALEQLEERMDKRFVEMNHRFTEMNQRISDVQADMNHRFTEMNQRISDVQADMNHRFTEVNQRLSDMQVDIRQLNQNHIDHLNRHHD